MKQFCDFKIDRPYINNYMTVVTFSFVMREPCLEDNWHIVIKSLVALLFDNIKKAIF